jgi:hypothetical protein
MGIDMMGNGKMECRKGMGCLHGQMGVVVLGAGIIAVRI